jgi:uncharacterized protein (DUF58 family)
MTQDAPSAGLRRGAEALAAPLPPLLAEASHLAATVQLGEHGRRRAGMGDEFWQYRPAHAGDTARMIDWRRSARADAHFVREKEWQAAQSVQIWVDPARSMGFAGDPGRPSKAERARLLALALAVLLIRGGERVGMADVPAPPRGGEVQLMRIAARLTDAGSDADYGAPEGRVLLTGARALFVSDFLGDPAAVEAALTEAADRGVRGALLQVLDPVEESFPFDGRTIFESMSGALRHETRKAGDLRSRYLDRLAERKDRLATLSRRTGWQFLTHHTDTGAQGALLWLYHALGQVR